MTGGSACINLYAAAEQDDMIASSKKICESVGINTTNLSEPTTSTDARPIRTISIAGANVDLHYDQTGDHAPKDPIMMIGFDERHITPVEWDEGTSTGKFLYKTVELVCELAIEFDCIYTDFCYTTGDCAGVMPTGAPISKSIDRLPVIGVYGDSMIEDFGGRERVFAAPAWRIDELRDGKILIIKDRNISENAGIKTEADEYLLPDR